MTTPQSNTEEAGYLDRFRMKCGRNDPMDFMYSVYEKWARKLLQEYKEAQKEKYGIDRYVSKALESFPGIYKNRDFHFSSIKLYYELYKMLTIEKCSENAEEYLRGQFMVNEVCYYSSFWKDCSYEEIKKVRECLENGSALEMEKTPEEWFAVCADLTDGKLEREEHISSFIEKATKGKYTTQVYQRRRNGRRTRLYKIIHNSNYIRTQEEN